MMRNRAQRTRFSPPEETRPRSGPYRDGPARLLYRAGTIALTHVLLQFAKKGDERLPLVVRVQSARVGEDPHCCLADGLWLGAELRGPLGKTRPIRTNAEHGQHFRRK